MSDNKGRKETLPRSSRAGRRERQRGGGNENPNDDPYSAANLNLAGLSQARAREDAAATSTNTARSSNNNNSNNNNGGGGGGRTRSERSKAYASWAASSNVQQNQGGDYSAAGDVYSAFVPGRGRSVRKKGGHDLASLQQQQQRYSMFSNSPMAAAALHQTHQMNQHAQLHAHQLHQQYLQLQAQMLIMQQQIQSQQDQARGMGQQQQAVQQSQSREFDETNVYVAHLPMTMTHEEFYELISKYGTVVSSRILVGDHWRKKGVKGVGFARMSNEEEALAAIKGINNLRVQGSNILLRARLAFKTIRRDGHPDGDDNDFMEGENDFRRRQARFPSHFRSPQWPTSSHFPLAAPAPHRNPRPPLYPTRNFGHPGYFDYLAHGGSSFYTPGANVPYPMAACPAASYMHPSAPHGYPSMTPPASWGLPPMDHSSCAAAAAAAAAATFGQGGNPYAAHQAATASASAPISGAEDPLRAAGTDDFWLGQAAANQDYMSGSAAAATSWSDLYAPIYYNPPPAGYPQIPKPGSSNLLPAQQAQPGSARSQDDEVSGSAVSIAPQQVRKKITITAPPEMAERQGDAEQGAAAADDAESKAGTTAGSTNKAENGGGDAKPLEKDEKGDRQNNRTEGGAAGDAPKRNGRLAGGCDSTRFAAGSDEPPHYPPFINGNPPAQQPSYYYAQQGAPVYMGQLGQHHVPPEVLQQMMQLQVDGQQNFLPMQTPYPVPHFNPGPVHAQLQLQRHRLHIPRNAQVTLQQLRDELRAATREAAEGQAGENEQSQDPPQQDGDQRQQQNGGLNASQENQEEQQQNRTNNGLSYNIHFAYAFPSQSVPPNPANVPAAPAPNFVSAIIAASKRQSARAAREEMIRRGREERERYLRTKREEAAQRKRLLKSLQQGDDVGQEGDATGQNGGEAVDERGQQGVGAEGSVPTEPTPAPTRPALNVSMEVAEQCAGIILPDSYNNSHARQHLDGIVWISCGSYPANPLMLYRDRYPIFGIYHPEFKIYWGGVFFGDVAPGLPLVSCPIPRDFDLPCVPRAVLGEEVANADVTQVFNLF